MKKILYSIIFSFIFLIGINSVSANDQICYYSIGNNHEASIVVVNKKAYVTKQFNLDEKKYYLNDTIELSGNTNCPSYLLLNEKGNKLIGYNKGSEPNQKGYIFSKYDFESILTCNYNGPRGTTGNKFNLVVEMNNYNDLLVTFDGDFAKSKYIQGRSYTLIQNSTGNFWSYFISYVKNNKKCPYMDLSVSYEMFPSDDDRFFTVTTEKNNIEGGKGIAKEYKKSKTYKHYLLEETFDIYIRTYTDMEEELCIFTSDDSKCISITNNDEETIIFTLSNGSNSTHKVKIDASEAKYIYKYINENDPYSLKDPGDFELKYDGNNGATYNWTISFVDNGQVFSNLLNELQPYFEKLQTYKKSDDIEKKLEVKINNVDTTFKWFVSAPSIDVADEELEYVTEQKIKDVVEYCNEYYKNASDNRKKDSFKMRMDECISFNEMLEEAASLGLIGNLAEGCAMLSKDFTDILKKILDIVKIAGPILALALGTLDFVKAITSNDADKELKTAFKRASTRILAAVLLFIIPFILAFLMDRFLINQDGYDPDNPFCSMDVWSNE